MLFQGILHKTPFAKGGGRGGSGKRPPVPLSASWCSMPTPALASTSRLFGPNLQVPELVSFTLYVRSWVLHLVVDFLATGLKVPSQFGEWSPYVWPNTSTPLGPHK